MQHLRRFLLDSLGKPKNLRLRLPSSSNDHYYNTPISNHSLLTPVFGYLFKDLTLNGFQTTTNFFSSFPLTTSSDLRRFESRPLGFKMLSGDFIEDSLYNPHYGYFSSHSLHFLDHSGDSQRNNLNLTSIGGSSANWIENHYTKSDLKQLEAWNTPTELFQPHFGEAIARYLLVNYKLNLYPYHDLVIFEIDGGNGILMCNILDFIKKHQPEVYAKTQYKIIRDPKTSIDRQSRLSLNKKLLSSIHASKIEIINKSILEWDEYVPEPCFILGLQVLDKLAHDVLKYDINTGKPYQGYVLIDDKGQSYEAFSPEIEEWSEKYLRYTSDFYQHHQQDLHPLRRSSSWAKLKNWVNPLQNDLSESEYIPTRLLKFFTILNKSFPDHQLVLSDYDSLMSKSSGINSPLVQSKDKSFISPTYMTEQGLFEIIFPTDFTVIRDLYIKICGRLIQNSKSDEFLANWADLEVTTLKNGKNPMLDLYSNTSFLHS